MFDLITRLYPELLIQAKKKRDLVERYIAQLVGDSKNIAILDIGWVGNMQGSFSRLLQLNNGGAKINGYYYGTIEGVKVNYGPKNHFHAYLVNDCEPSRWYQAIMTGGVELLEFAQTAPHGTTLGYEVRDGLIYPVFEDNKDDQVIQGLASRTQQGAMHFIEKAMPLIERLGYYSFVSKAWAEPFYRLVMKPTREEAEHLGALTHSDIAADTSKRLQLAEKIAKGPLGAFGPGYRQAYEAAYWKMGFKVRNS
jgi:predicted HAD superfamily hydrolase